MEEHPATEIGGNRLEDIRMLLTCSLPIELFNISVTVPAGLGLVRQTLLSPRVLTLDPPCHVMFGCQVRTTTSRFRLGRWHQIGTAGHDLGVVV